jgi:hypothetical protein
MWRFLISLATLQLSCTKQIISTMSSQQLVAFQSASKLIHTRGYRHLWFQINLEKPIQQIQGLIIRLRGQM